MATSSTPVADVHLVLFLKAPQNSKRRLAAEIGARARDAAAHLWRCALEDMAGWRGPRWFSPAAPEDASWLASERGSTAEMIPQSGGNLGERINHVDRQLRSRGVEKLIFIGTDCPGLDSDYLERAAARLDEFDAVLGPSTDGGVVLMGARLAWPALGKLAWSTGRLSDELWNVCADHGWAVDSLELRADIDTVRDLLAARDELANDGRPARRNFSAWLSAQHDLLTFGTRGESRRAK